MQLVNCQHGMRKIKILLLHDLGIEEDIAYTPSLHNIPIACGPHNCVRLTYCKRDAINVGHAK